MRCLVVLPIVPHPPDRGDRLRALDMLRALATGFDLQLLLLTREPGEASALEALAALPAAVALLPLPPAQRLRGAAAGLARGLPPAITAHWCSGLQRTVAARFRGPWDLAVAFQLRAAPYVQAVEARATLLELTDSLTLYRQRLPLRGRALRQRLALSGVHRLEARLPPTFQGCVVSAPADADRIAALSGVRPFVIPNGTPPAHAPRPYRTGGPLLFVGDMRYPPNEDAITWLVQAAWPRIRLTAPDMRLRIVGRTTPRVDRLAHVPGVEVAGYVTDIAREFDAALAVVNPIRFGSGTNRKLLDAWAAARPVISSPLGARGLDGTVGESLWLADSAEDWARAVSALCRDPSAAARLGQAGFDRLVRSLPRPDAWRQVWTQALAAGRSPPSCAPASP